MYKGKANISFIFEFISVNWRNSLNFNDTHKRLNSDQTMQIYKLILENHAPVLMSFNLN